MLALSMKGNIIADFDQFLIEHKLQRIVGDNGVMIPITTAIVISLFPLFPLKKLSK